VHEVERRLRQRLAPHVVAPHVDGVAAAARRASISRSVASTRPVGRPGCRAMPRSSRRPRRHRDSATGRHTERLETADRRRILIAVDPLEPGYLGYRVRPLGEGVIGHRRSVYP